MIGRDHEITSGAVCATTVLLVNFPVHATWVNLPVVVLTTVIGALVPDIDHKNSMITKKFHLPFYHIFNHRGITHSIFGWLLWTGLLFGLFQLIFRYSSLHAMLNHWSFAILAGFSFGYFLHLLEDSWSQAGIRWLAPISGYDQYSYQHYGTLLRMPSRFKKVRGRSKKVPIRHWWGRGYVVGGRGETVLVSLSLVFALIALVRFLVIN